MSVIKKKLYIWDVNSSLPNNLLKNSNHDMNHIVFPFENKPGVRRLSFYLATEQWVAAHLPDDDYLFTWVVNPTVICGRHQDIPLEVDMEYCRANGIDIVRRHSGGGCVYADCGNIMISFITPGRGRSIEQIFSGYTTMIVSRLRTLGIEAEASGRNDISVGGRKISGGAFYRQGERNISHSTMLHTIDHRHISNAITPSRAKLASHGVTSVASRVVTLAELYPDLSFERLRSTLESVGPEDTTTVLSPDNIKAIEAIQQSYDDPSRLMTIHNCNHSDDL